MNLYKRGRVWWVSYYVGGDRKYESLKTRDKRSAHLIAAERIRKAELRRAGVVDPYEEHKSMAIEDHLADFETTLAARSYGQRLRRLQTAGYRIHLLFLWLPTADIAVARVADRVRLGGHNVPEETVRRRYESGLRNFFEIYRPLASSWQMYDNSDMSAPRLIAEGSDDRTVKAVDEELWKTIVERYDNEE